MSTGDEISLLKQIEKTVEDITYTGLTTVSETTFQRLAAVINECSSKKYFRLASTLRVATSELKKAVTVTSSNGHSKYAFFLNQSWLLSKGLMKAIEDGDKLLYEKYSGAVLDKKTISTLEIVPIGLEKGLIDNQWLKFTFHFKVISSDEKELENSILCWNQMFDTKNSSAKINAERELANKIKGLNDEYIGEFITSDTIKLINWDYSPSNNSVSVGDDSSVKFLENSQVSGHLPLFRAKEFMKYLKDLQITPLDHAFTFTYWTGFPDVRIKYQNNAKGFTGMFEYESLNIKIDLPRNITNQTLITRLGTAISSLNKKIPYFYGILVIDSSELVFTPLSLVETGRKGVNDKFTFLAVDEEKTKNFISEAKNQPSIKSSTDREKNLALLGGFVGKKKK
ncbi:MAG: hypothetical protein ACFFD4_27950 [Candidatus Odinarchaeota archaeon]